MSQELLSIKEASEWATKFLGRPVTISNIQYLIQYAKVAKTFYKNNTTINVDELKNYYERDIKKEEEWKKRLGKDLNWGLSFGHLKESDTTKHVHRLHPYKGKFIPQLVEYFLDPHLNTFKKEVFFKSGNIILDPFMGSGTTLVQCSELGLHSIGIDVSDFNCLISEVKVGEYDLSMLDKKARDICFKTVEFSQEVFDDSFDEQLKERLNEFNKKYFPNPEFKKNIWKGIVSNEEQYGEEKLKQFLKENEEFFEKNGTKDKSNLLNEKEMSNFLNKWFSKRVKQELFYYIKLLRKVEDENLMNVLRIILSRTARSCRATTHSDLATLTEPQTCPYYCRKHKKLCTPINSIIKHLIRYTYDTVKRIDEFSKLKKNVSSEIIHGDSREVNIFEEIKNKNPEFYNLLTAKKIDGVFTSPPYVGQINYHEQHAYAYELFSIPREDNKEIGPLSKGQGQKAKDEYVEGISKVFINISKFIKDDGDLFIVANDKYNLYPLIAEKSGLKIIEQFKRPVLNRTERDRQPYAEIIFHMRKMQH
ncbi:MAG: DNA methyltransferase [Candidatus Nanoarchaeia archaeon]|nr:DNA methyltransferase [Candidatus Nanoarchaeia archaeon]MDD5740397.1 DNA methyltransferase [Candidatus Nanoarchaeia archaeon]